MTTKLTVRSTSQKIAERNTIGVSVVIGTTAVVILTAATGKKIMIKKVLIESNGGGANGSMTIRHNTLDLDSISISNETLLQNKPNAADIVLSPGDTLNMAGDSASNNGAAEFDVTFQETTA